MRATKLSGAIGLILVLEGCAAGKINNEETVGVTAEAYETADAISEFFASRLRSTVTGGQSLDDFQIALTPIYNSIGSIMRSGKNVAIEIDRTACIPKFAIPQQDMPNMAVNFKYSKSVGANVGLDEKLLKGIATFGVDVKDSDTIELNIENAQIQALTDNELKQIWNDPVCINAITGNTVQFVRGYVSGKRKFLVKAEGKATVEGKIVQIGTFKIERVAGNPTIEIADQNPSRFLQITSAMSLVAVASDIKVAPAASIPAVPTTSTSAPLNSAPTASGSDQVPMGTISYSDRAGLQFPAQTISQTITVTPKIENIKVAVSKEIGRISVNRSSEDKTDVSKRLVEALKASELQNVATGIEAIGKNGVPENAQVRFFKKEDESRALKVLEQVRQFYPKAEPIYVKLTAPPGQIDVFLPNQQ